MTAWFDFIVQMASFLLGMPKCAVKVTENGVGHLQFVLQFSALVCKLLNMCVLSARTAASWEQWSMHVCLASKLMLEMKSESVARMEFGLAKSVCAKVSGRSLLNSQLHSYCISSFSDDGLVGFLSILEDFLLQHALLFGVRISNNVFGGHWFACAFMLVYRGRSI